MKVKVTQSCPTLWNPVDYIVHGILQARILERVAFPFSRGSSQPWDQTQVSRIAGGFLLAEPQGKPKNTGVGSLSLLQEISRSRNRTGVCCIAGRLSMAGVNRHLSIEAGEKVKVYDSSEKCFIYLTIS